MQYFGAVAGAIHRKSRHLTGALVLLAALPTWAESLEIFDIPLDPSCEWTEYPHLDLSRESNYNRVRSALDELEGHRIRHIRIVSGDIFDENDPDENNALFRGLNRVHINTTVTTIRAQLLMTEGEDLRSRYVNESERILRTRSYLSDAYIVPEVVCDGGVDLLVLTRDAWVTEPEVYFGYEGGETRSGFGLKDGNFLGSGDNLSVGYVQDELRSSVTYDYRSPHLFNTQLRARVSYADKSDGTDKVFSLEQPFYSLDSPWAAGYISENISEVNVVRNRGEDINEYRQRMIKNEVYYGRALTVGSDDIRRLLIGLTSEEDRFSETDASVTEVPTDRRANYPWLAYEYIENDYGTYRNVYQIQRTEDIAQGLNIYLRAGYGGASLGNDRDVVRFKGRVSNYLDIGPGQLLRVEGQLDGRYYPNFEGSDSTVAQTRIDHHYFIDRNNRWFTSFRYAQGYDLAQHEELTLGGISGLRGYPTDFQRGAQRYLLTVERRYFSDIHLLNIVRMGGVAFIDAGRAWGGEGNRDNSHLSNLGLGLRFTSSKARIGNLLHIDVAVPTGTRENTRSVQWLIKGSTVF
ncbi:BamA/TamA family outer membrane protein [Marinimicrobium alkaliphilum]|uniref:hypothetical protein n=1 Tax=Marinimicrobium alkaliphilum TaxID=2202654 RepID=UPI000DBAB88B|nr:hypothetical protein [Marinimicrobium alkaliphilum]